MRGVFKGVAIDYETRKLLISFLVDSCEPSEWKNKDLDITVEEHKEKRGDPQNKYFHKLCDLLRQKLNISFNACKNHLIASYGQVKYLPNGDIETIKTNIEPGTVNEWAFVHWELIRVTENAYFYRVHRPTHGRVCAANTRDGRRVQSARDRDVKPARVGEIKKGG